ncbi:MAG: response regulator [Gemmatimonadetes bacterium]|nr:response regulator [Gemmatimonadota bacterium]
MTDQENARLIHLVVDSETDVIAARQRARQITGLLGFDSLNQIRIATAVSELAWNAQHHAKEATIDFQLAPSVSPTELRIVVRDGGPGIADVESLVEAEIHPSRSGFGVRGVSNLSEGFAIESSSSGTLATIAEPLPPQGPKLSGSAIDAMREHLQSELPSSPTHEIILQNQDLLVTHERLRTWNLQLLDLNRDLEESNATKERFLRVLSHEFRNGLGALALHVEQLRMEETLPGWLREVEESMSRQLTDLTRIVNDLVDLSAAGTDTLAIEPEVVNASELISSIAEDLRWSVEVKGLEMVIDCPAEENFTHADPTRIRQVLSNLIRNAVKFTKSGGRVSVGIRPSHDPAEFAIFVRDSGMGIPPDELSTLFQPFRQGVRPARNAEQGLGLGLAISEAIVKMHGGRFEVHSDGPGKGAEFRFFLPRTDDRPDKTETRSAPSEDHGERQAGRRVLIVEDHEATANGLKKILELDGHRVQVACDGRSGLALHDSFQPDIVLCDLDLPDISGYEVVDKVQTSRTDASCRIFILSGSSEIDHVSSLAGADAIFPKPVDVAKLRAALRE